MKRLLLPLILLSCTEEDVPKEIPSVNMIIPEVEAASFVSSLGFKFGGASCQKGNLDVVNCSARVADSDKVFALECAALDNKIWTGCKERLAPKNY